MIEENGDRIAQSIYKDLRRPVEVNKQMEVTGSVNTIDICLENLDEWVKPQKASSACLIAGLENF